MTEIRLHNTATRRKETFEPLDPENVRMYVCGPTVYDRAHIGNARPVVVFDVLYRLLRHVYGPDHVTYVRNITDVEDKIIDRAAERGVSIATVTEETTRWFHEDMKALGVDYSGDPRFHEPRATAYIPEMVAMIERLIAEGKAYEADGHVLFDVKSYPDYGRLAGRSVDDMIAGARVEVAPYKRDPMDFVLWKPSSGDQPGWESPWGRGRPGWHIECSAMSHALLGPDFDIHGGGADLQFPHHENEVAQSKCAHPGSGFARFWLHNGMIRVEGQKMAKSLGNFITVKDLRNEVPGEVIRLAMLMTHYRGPLDWTKARVSNARHTLTNWFGALSGMLDIVDQAKLKIDLPEPSEDVVSALADDLNTHQAISFISEFAKSDRRDDQLQTIVDARFLGLLGPDVGNTLRIPTTKSISKALRIRVDELLAERENSRAARDFGRADEIRTGLAAAGVEISDTPYGTKWNLTPEFDPAKLEDVR